MKTRFVLLCLIILIFACSAKPDQTATADFEAKPVSAVSQPSPQHELPRDVYSNGKTKLIKTLNYKFEVEDSQKTTEAIEASVKKYPAYVSDSKMNTDHAWMETKITIRVQNDFFHELIKEIDQQAKTIHSRNITTQDVAKEFVDLESRLKTKREVEQRYAEILRKNAGTITELLEAEQKIGELHEEIEATVSRINYLKDQVNYSTINLEFYQPVTHQLADTENNSIGKDFSEALYTGWSGLVNFTLVLAYVWPLLIVGIITGALYWLRKRRVVVHR
jgi:hypothetical protein